MFGEIPLLEKVLVAPDGSTRVVETLDLDYQQPLPRGAVRGDPRQQTFCCDLPRYYFLDVARSCVQCGERFVFSAEEQKHWYETLHFRLDSTAIRCKPCRRRRRSERAIREALAAASRAAADASGDAGALLAFAEATVAHVDRLGTGPIDRALAAARRARRLRPELAEARFWEARCHEAAGRLERAEAAYRELLAERGPAYLAKPLVRHAEAFLAALTTGPSGAAAS